MTRHKMLCPDCGIEMNFHAEKVDYTDAGAVDPMLGGVIEEAHSCPGCGKTLLRHEEPGE